MKLGEFGETLRSVPLYGNAEPSREGLWFPGRCGGQPVSPDNNLALAPNSRDSAG